VTRLRRDLVLVLAVAFLPLAGAPALAAVPPTEGPPPAALEKVLGALGVPDCACEIDVAELERYRDLVAEAESAEAARALASRPSRLARRALGAARRLLPWSGGLRDAHGKLLAYEGRVAKTQTPAEAAREFEGLVRLAGGSGVTVGGNSGRCHYTTLEIIAIVLGFLLFIIPGIILLIVLC
jgi:hypothetical protein